MYKLHLRVRNGGEGVPMFRGINTMQAELTKFRFVKINGKRSSSNLFGRSHSGIYSQDIYVLLIEESDIYLGVDKLFFLGALQNIFSVVCFQELLTVFLLVKF